jgi:hypothetical protein
MSNDLGKSDLHGYFCSLYLGPGRQLSHVLNVHMFGWESEYNVAFTSL